jgi:hypothetical protein
VGVGAGGARDAGLGESTSVSLGSTGSVSARRCAGVAVLSAETTV